MMGRYRVLFLLNGVSNCWKKSTRFKKALRTQDSSKKSAAHLNQPVSFNSTTLKDLEEFLLSTFYGEDALKERSAHVYEIPFLLLP